MTTSPITSRSTKPQLVAHIASLDAQLRSANVTAANLRLQMSTANVVVDELRRKLDAATVHTVQAPRLTYAPRERNTSLPAHFAAAREAAMRLGCSVKVTA